MDWKKAKNYIIILLMTLNIVLLGLNILKYNKYNLSQDQKNSIISILKDNNIIIEAKFPESFKPMPQITLKVPTYDVIELQNIFFSDSKSIKRTEVFEKTIFSSENESLTLNGNQIFYENKNKTEGFNLNEKTALKKVEPYITAIEKNFNDFYLKKTVENDGCITLRYDQNHINNIIFNNSITFKVYSDSSLSCSFSYFEPIHVSADKADICSADEAVFTFYNSIKDTFEENSKIKITDIDLGYFTEEYAQNNQESYAVPHYRIFIDQSDEPYYINAYNSSMFYK